MPTLRRHVRSGTTLVELVAALAVTGVFAGALVRALDRAIRLHAGSTVLVEQQAQGTAAAAILRELLGDVTPASQAFVSTDTSVVAQASVGSAVACAASPPFIEVPPELLASGRRLAFWNTSPQAGDSLWWYDEGSLGGVGDDRWLAALVTASSALTGPCAGTPYVDALRDAGRIGWRLTLAAGGPTAGAPVRLTRPVRLALYRSTPDWMLGYTEWDPQRGAWHTIQPVAGALEPPSSLAGLALLHHDSSGSVTSHAPPPAGLSIAVRARRRSAVRIDGRNPLAADSVRTWLAFRNPP